MLIYETKRWIYIFGCSDVSVLLGGGTGISNQVRGSNKNSGSSNIKEGDRVGESNETRGSKGTNGETQLETCYNFIKISRRDDLNDRKKHTLNDIITIDPHTYTRSDARNLLSTLSAIAASEGDQLTGPTVAISIIGFVRFLRGYYLILATERTLLGHIAGHAIYGIANTSITQIWRSIYLLRRPMLLLLVPIKKLKKVVNVRQKQHQVNQLQQHPLVAKKKKELIMI